MASHLGRRAWGAAEREGRLARRRRGPRCSRLWERWRRTVRLPARRGRRASSLGEVRGWRGCSTGSGRGHQRRVAECFVRRVCTARRQALEAWRSTRACSHGAGHTVGTAVKRPCFRRRDQTRHCHAMSPGVQLHRWLVVCKRCERVTGGSGSAFARSASRLLALRLMTACARALNANVAIDHPTATRSPACPLWRRGCRRARAPATGHVSPIRPRHMQLCMYARELEL